MSLDLGELVGTLRMDITPFDQALMKGEAALNGFATSGKAAAGKAGTQISDELAATMADLPVNAKGLISETSAEFHKLGPEMKAAVLEAKADAAAGLAGMKGDLSAEARSAGTAAASALGAGLDGAEAEAEAAGAKAGRGFSDEFKDGAKTAGAAAGAGVGAAIGVGIVDNMSVEAGLNKVAAQLGLSQADMKTAGKIAGKVYANNFGEDLPQINEAVVGVVRNMNIGMNDVDLQPVTEKVLTLVDVFDQDLGMTTAGIGQMIRTGMVKDAQEGLDVLTAGLQSPANKADDLMETMNEYGVQFEKLGLNGRDAMGLMSQGLQGGARDADTVADALKEFSLKTQESTTTVTKLADGTKALSLNELGSAFEAVGVQVLDADGKLSDVATTFQKDLAGGGPKAKKALDQVLDGLKNIEDPATRTRTAVALFGTKAEDMGDSLNNLDLDTARKELGKVGGAAEEVQDQMASGAQATIGAYGRKLVDMGRDAVDALGPVGSVAGAVVGILPAVVSVVGPVVGSWLAMSGASVSGALAMAGAWLVAIAPIAIVIAAIAGVAFLIYKYWDEIKEATGKAWDWVVEQVKKVPGLLVSAFQNFTLIGLLVKHWDSIKDGVEKGWDSVTDYIGKVPGKVLGFFSGAGNLLKEKGKDLLEGLKDGASNKWDQVSGWVSNIPDRFANTAGNMANTLKDKGRDLLQGLRDGAGDKWDNVVGWVQGIPERFTNNVGGVANTLKDKGRELIQGLRDGAGEKWDNIVDWVSNTGTRVSNSVGNLGTLLKDAGIAIVQGLIDGIEAKFQALKDKVGAITNWVKDHKGPKAYDLTLWRGPGNWIMEGLMNGLDDQMPALKGKVGDVTDTIASTPIPTLYASASPGSIPESAEVAGYAAGQAGGGGGLTQNIYETTNAQATAAESARRLALAGAGA